MIENQNFGQALEAMALGQIVTRMGWNGKNMWIFMQVGNVVSKDYIPNFKSLPERVKDKFIELNKDVVFRQSITIMTADGTLQPGWHPS